MSRPGGAWLDDAPLFAAWQRFVRAGHAPFTVPGHKRRGHLLAAALERLLDSDVPMYGGVDEIKLASGVLAESESMAAGLWGADWCRFSVGGSTHANQVLTLAVGRPGDTVLVARNAHRSVLSGLALADLRPVWLPSTVDAATGVPTGLDVAALAAALDAHPQAAAVMCVEPGYLGALSDLPAVVALAHARDVPVVVDQAWGAHLGFHPAYPRHALQTGADAMVMSAHKTLPAYTQGAIVAASTGRLDRDRLERAFETSHTTSPAGSILAATDAARALLASPTGVDLLGALVRLAAALRDDLADAGLPTVRPGDFPAGRYDPAKLVLLTGPAGVDGVALERRLLDAGLPVEMADSDTVVPMLTIADDDESVRRLRGALLAALAELPRASRPVVPSAIWTHTATVALTPREAFFAPHRTVPRAAATGAVSAELVAPYPPGIPVVVPGEVLTEATLAVLDAARAAGTRIAYAADPSLSTFQVVG